MVEGAHLNAKQTLVIGFSLIILTGAFLLMLPAASRSGASIPFLNALFTAASATCVTGLVVYDTWTQFTLLGQIVIMLLIQIGGLGFMTFAILIAMVLKKRIGLKERFYLMEAISSMQIGGVVRLAKKILLGTLIFEGIGAAVLSLRFCPELGLAKGIWYGLFHSVSAFCNAGFDLMGYRAPYASFNPFAGDIIVNLTIMSLIIVGGIGFVVWDDVLRHKWHFRQYNLHTKIAFSITGVLIIGAAALLLILEKDAAFAGMTGGEKVLAALFQAVTPRTAGFNTVDIATLSDGGLLLTMLLMIIGAGPGSTGGGIKITTFAVLLLSVLTNAKRQEDVNVFNRRLEPDLVGQAFSSTAIYIMLAFCGCLMLTAVQNLPLSDAMFETFSALGTVGLTTGITRELAPVSRLVIILLMFAGRIGSLTVFMAVTENKSLKQLRNPVERIIVG